MSLIDPLALLPAPGQGALALQCREDDATTRGFLSFLTDDETAQCVAAERALVKLLRGDCTSPIAAYATIEAGEIVLKAAVGARSGNPPVLRVLARGDDPKSAANEVYYILVQQHVESLLFG
jgi:hydroxymethylbilane synthase